MMIAVLVQSCHYQTTIMYLQINNKGANSDVSLSEMRIVQLLWELLYHHGVHTTPKYIYYV